MLDAFLAEQVPVPISTIVVDGPVLDLRMTFQVFACVFGEGHTYEVMQKDNGPGVIDTTALRREIAGCRLPDRVSLNFTPEQATRGLARAVRVSRHLDVPIGFYAKGHYNNAKRTPLTALMYMGFLPAPIFLRELKRVARG